MCLKNEKIEVKYAICNKCGGLLTYRNHRQCKKCDSQDLTETNIWFIFKRMGVAETANKKIYKLLDSSEAEIERLKELAKGATVELTNLRNRVKYLETRKYPTQQQFVAWKYRYCDKLKIKEISKIMGIHPTSVFRLLAGFRKVWPRVAPKRRPNRKVTFRFIEDRDSNPKTRF